MTPPQRGFAQIVLLAIAGAAIAFVSGGIAGLYVHHQDQATIGTDSADWPSVSSTQAIPVAASAPSATPKSSQRDIPASPGVASAANMMLQIEKVRTQVDEQKVVIAWETTVDAESQLILDSGNGKGFESANGIGTNHEVTIIGLAKSAEYDYEIIAKTPDKRQLDTYYGSFNGYKEYTVRLGDFDAGDKCQDILARDTAGNPAAGISIGIDGRSGSKLLPSITATTDLYGTVRYCKTSSIATYHITGPNGLDITL